MMDNEKLGRPYYPPASPVEPRTVNTRIALRIDQVSAWQNSVQPLYPGEIAISYQVSSDGSRYDFRMKAGCRNKYGNLMVWNELPFMGEDQFAAPEDIADLSAQLLEQLVKNEDFTPEALSSMLSDAFQPKNSAQPLDLSAISAGLSDIFAKKSDVQDADIEKISAQLSTVFELKGAAQPLDLSAISAGLSDIFAKKGESVLTGMTIDEVSSKLLEVFEKKGEGGSGCSCEVSSMSSDMEKALSSKFAYKTDISSIDVISSALKDVFIQNENMPAIPTASSLSGELAHVFLTGENNPTASSLSGELADVFLKKENIPTAASLSADLCSVFESIFAKPDQIEKCSCSISGLSSGMLSALSNTFAEKSEISSIDEISSALSDVFRRTDVPLSTEISSISAELCSIFSGIFANPDQIEKCSCSVSAISSELCGIFVKRDEIDGIVETNTQKYLNGNLESQVNNKVTSYLNEHLETAVTSYAENYLKSAEGTTAIEGVVDNYLDTSDKVEGLVKNYLAGEGGKKAIDDEVDTYLNGKDLVTKTDLDSSVQTAVETKTEAIAEAKAKEYLKDNLSTEVSSQISAQLDEKVETKVSQISNDIVTVVINRIGDVLGGNATLATDDDEQSQYGIIIDG